MSGMAGANVCLTVRVKATDPKTQGEFVEINESDFDPARHVRFADLAFPPPPPLPLPPPPAPPPSPVANLPKAWRDGKTQALRELAEKVTGRTPETREQAVQMIEAALANRPALASK